MLRVLKMKKIYLIFTIDSNSIPILLNLTTDYYYFKRLSRKYIKQNKTIFTRYVYIQDLIDNSKYL